MCPLVAEYQKIVAICGNGLSHFGQAIGESPGPESRYGAPKDMNPL